MTDIGYQKGSAEADDGPYDRRRATRRDRDHRGGDINDRCNGANS
jgi:hypothetical protein